MKGSLKTQSISCYTVCQSSLHFLSGQLLTSSDFAKQKEVEYLSKLEKWSDVNICYKNMIESRCISFNYLLITVH